MVISTTNKQDSQKEKYHDNQNINKDNITYKIITDEPDKDAYNFRKYSERLSYIIANSTPKFTIGIFGGWGTGKTTMMQMIKRQLETMNIISWKNINQDSEKDKLKNFIKDTYKINWIDNAKYYKSESDDKKLIIENPVSGNNFSTDSKGTYSLREPNHFSLLINKTNAILKSDDGKILTLKIKKENNNEISIYLSDSQILTLWFDAWRYEKEEFSALIPLIRTIILHLEEYVLQSKSAQGNIAFTNLIKNFKKLGKLIIKNSMINTGFEKFGAKVSIQTDMNKVLSEYKSQGSVTLGQREIHFYKHISERIEDELRNIRKSDTIREGKMEDIELEETRKFKMVIFVDDLDRCTPEKALEIIESIKTFFDMEGLIYVIGMDPTTIDHLIYSKYGEKSRINGLYYLQKIVQLHFKIPLLTTSDFEDMIKKMTYTTKLPNYVIDILLENRVLDLITLVLKSNPRNIKRFINSLVLFYDTYGKKIINSNMMKDYLKSLIVMQTFNFREDWLPFLNMIIPYFIRIQFLKHFIIEYEKVNSYQDFEDKVKNSQAINYPKYNRKILEIYNKIIEINDEDLFIFLKDTSEILLRIGDIENYLRLVDIKRDVDTTKKIVEIYEYEDSLSYTNEDFKEFYYHSIVHFPYTKLQYAALQNISPLFATLFQADLSGANLFQAALFQADLSRADLSEADLSEADLSEADLFQARLSNANLFQTKLSLADLSEADLSGANLFQAALFQADLSRANLSIVDLSGANLSRANLSNAKLFQSRLSGANLSGANLSGTDLFQAKVSLADLSEADLSGADLSGADLSKADLSKADLSKAKLSKAKLSGADLSGADLSEADLSETDLSNTVLYNSIIITPQNYESLKLNIKTNFANAITNDVNFIYYISNLTENIPEIVNNKKELKLKLGKRSYDKEYIEDILSISNLPEE